MNSVVIIYHSEKLEIDKNCNLHEERVSRRRVTYQDKLCAHFCPQFTITTIYSGSDLAVTEFTV